MNTIVDLNLKHIEKGYFAEQLASAWLIKQGYWVFKNISQHGAVDCVAINQKTHEIILIDVKVISKTRKGSTRSKILTEKQRAMGVKLLYVDAEKLECRFKESRADYIKMRKKAGGLLYKLPTIKI